MTEFTYTFKNTQSETTETDLRFKCLVTNNETGVERACEVAIRLSDITDSSQVPAMYAAKCAEKKAEFLAIDQATEEAQNLVGTEPLVI